MWMESTKLHNTVYELVTNRAVSGGLAQVKVRIPELFPYLEGRFIYLDSDIIVQGDVWELLTTSISPGDVGLFAEDCSHPVGPLRGTGGKARYATFVNLQHSRLRTANIDPASCPFSTGVFVANMTKWKEEGVVASLEQWIKGNSREAIVGVLPGVSVVEAAMLIEFYGRVTRMDPLWHVQHLGASSGSRYSRQFVEKAKLLHWSGHLKPWQHRSAHTEFWDRYFIPDPTALFRPIRKRG